jgi:hypothetical protein
MILSLTSHRNGWRAHIYNGSEVWHALQLLPELSYLTLNNSTYLVQGYGKRNHQRTWRDKLIIIVIIYFTNETIHVVKMPGRCKNTS